jgi:glycosyltransferase involved in cell wall biosynthesis
MSDLQGKTIVHVTECFASGTYDVIKNLAVALNRLGASQIILFSRRPETPNDFRENFPTGVEFIEVAPAKNTHLKFLRELKAAIDVLLIRGVDIIHLHSSKAGFAGRVILATWAKHGDLYYSPHGLSFLDRERPFKNFLFKSLERFAGLVKCVPVGCGVSEAKILSLLTKQKSTMLENPVDPVFFTVPMPAQQLRTVLSVGRVSRQKAPERFGALANGVRKNKPDANFVWVGNGDEVLTQELSEADVEVTGWMTRSDVIVRYQQASIYVQTSRWEGLPISVLQAMAVGLPCVVMDAVGNRDTVTHGFSGFVAQNESEMIKYVEMLLDDEPLRLLFGERARVEAQNRFSDTAFLASVQSLYASKDTS